MAYIDRDVLGIALALSLGLLIGLEREWSDSGPIGLRTFALLAGVGATSAVLSGQYDSLVIVAAIIAAALLLMALAHPAGEESRFRGATTTVAGLVTLLIGAMAASGLWLEAVVMSAATMLLLHWREPLHHLVDQIGAEDFDIIARFTLIALVVLPVLPDRAFGPYDVFNPFETWLFVVLIVGLNLAGYVLFRMYGKSSGLWLAGTLGGMISSTATAISYAGISKQQKSMGPGAALVILVASAVVYGRILLELSIVAPNLVRHAAAPMALYTVIILAIALLVYRRTGSTRMKMPEQENPAQFGMAFGVVAVFVVVLFAVAVTRDLIGEEGVYLVALVSGLTDVDALTLSVGRNFAEGQVGAKAAWRSVFLATLSNLVFKTGIACVLGSKDLRREMLVAGTLAVLLGALVLYFWP